MEMHATMQLPYSYLAWCYFQCPMKAENLKTIFTSIVIL